MDSDQKKNRGEQGRKRSNKCERAEVHHHGTTNYEHNLSPLLFIIFLAVRAMLRIARSDRSASSLFTFSTTGSCMDIPPRRFCKVQ